MDQQLDDSSGITNNKLMYHHTHGTHTLTHTHHAHIHTHIYMYNTHTHTHTHHTHAHTTHTHTHACTHAHTHTHTHSLYWMNLILTVQPTVKQPNFIKKAVENTRKKFWQLWKKAGWMHDHGTCTTTAIMRNIPYIQLPTVIYIVQ